MGDVFYRIVRNETPTADDYRTSEEEGLPLFNEAHYREWAEGISVYDDFDFALKRARTNKSDLGRFVATIVIPDGSGIDYAKTFGPRHYTIYARASRP